MGVASQFYTPVCDNKVPSLVASLFSWRCLAASTSSFLHAAINLRPPSVTVSTHTSAFKAVAFQSPAMPNVQVIRRCSPVSVYAALGCHCYTCMELLIVIIESYTSTHSKSILYLSGLLSKHQHIYVCYYLHPVVVTAVRVHF